MASKHRFDEYTPWLNTLQCHFVSGMSLRETFALNLRQTREAVGLSQEELAHRAQIDRTYVSSLERCQYAATLDVIERLARALNADPASLLQKPVDLHQS
ncbi:helix-turn-helix domain-containing protein [Croceibacterium atlanticum]|uniref:helix-turn-helix domain-containing protein n=2 Tax=Alphaproteobacteria TaxID=28211 RepID=UPI001FD55FEC|nr:helix-turn-helix transcriptional regulator [Croceibacterium atlanticum]